ncbi:PilZ domain-containing protein [bacterium]|nr:PilZ domain-containing protein [bacterium]
MSSDVEERKHRRLALAVPVLFTVKSKTGTGLTRSGVTRDVSPGGIFFRADAAQDLQTTQEITIKLVIPRQGDLTEPTVSLSGQARVLRAERLDPAKEGEGGHWGIAAQFVSRPSVDLSTVSTLFSAQRADL